MAVVPESELSAWTANLSAGENPETDWLKSVPTSLDLSGISEWYVDGRNVVGVDRAKRIVACRLYAD